MINTKQKALWAAILVLALETYSFVVFLFLARGIDSQFSIKHEGSFQIWFDLALGFLARPLGSLFFGNLADRFGRKPLLVLLTFLMGLATFLFSIVPLEKNHFYHLIPYCLILFRAFQGIIFGSDLLLTNTYLLELAPKGKRGLFASLTCVGQEFGTFLGVLAALSFFIIPQNQDPTPLGWRLSFISGTIFMLIGFHIRHNLIETNEYKPSFKRNFPVKSLFMSYKSVIFKLFLIIPAHGISFYLFRDFILNSSRVADTLPTISVLVLSIFSSVVNLIFALVGGYLSDIVGRKPVLISSAVALLLLSWPMLVLMIHPGDYQMVFVRVLVGQTILGIFSGLYYGALSAVLSEIFPAAVRVIGAAFTYNLSISFFTGRFPVINVFKYLSQKADSFPGIYMMFWSLVALLMVSFTLKETYKEELE